MKTITDAMLAHIQGGVTTLCTCVDVIRQDGSAFYFTDHDVPLLVGGNLHLPNYGYQRTSVTSTVNLEIDTLDIAGIMQGSDAQAGALASISIAREDIDAGAFDFAVVYIYLVNWADLSMGTIPLRRGWLGEIITNEDGTYKAEIRGLSQVFAYRVGEAFSPDCRADLGDVRCKVALSPDPWVANNGYLAGDRVLGVIDPADGYFNLNIVNASFEEPLTEDPGPDVPGWIVSGSTTQVWTRQQTYAGVPPQDGSYQIVNVNFTGEQGSGAELSQAVNLVDAGLTTSDLDTGKCRLVATAACCSLSGQSTYRFQVIALDVNGATLSTVYDSGARHTSTTKFVVVGPDNVLLPSGTRSIKFVLISNKHPQDAYGVSFDLVTAAVNDPSGTFGGADQYGGVAFTCTQTGISGATAPDWSNLVGSTYTDGTAAWVCVTSPKQVATVTTVGGGNNFTSTGVTQEAGYFDDGVLTWETGANAGRSAEIRTWDGTTMTMLFSTFHPMAVGDRFVVYPGCQKTRSVCVDKFANVENMRGEPDVPGQDKLMATPDLSATE